MNLFTEMYQKNDLSLFEEDYISEFKNNLPILQRTDELKVFEDLNYYNKQYYMFQKFTS